MDNVQKLGKYRFIRFIKLVTPTTRGLQDTLQVFFDVDQHPQGFYETSEAFLSFLNQEHNVELEQTELYNELRTALTVYGVHFVLDTKKWTLLPFEKQAQRAPTLKEILYTDLSNAGQLSTSVRFQPSSRRRKPQSSYEVRIDSPSMNKLWNLGMRK